MTIGYSFLCDAVYSLVMSLRPNLNSIDQPVDVLIVGGGIVGAGVARDAAMRGLSTLLIDKQDFAACTSGRSSRLLHGGRSEMCVYFVHMYVDL